MPKSSLFRRASVVLGAFLLAASAVRAQWEPRGVATGSASVIEVFAWKDNGNLLEHRVGIGSAGAGYYQFQDDGGTANFISRNNGLFDHDITGLAADPTDATRQKLFVATKNGVFQTSDGGLTWSELIGSPSLPVAAKDTSDIAVTYNVSNQDKFVWLSTLTQGIYRIRVAGTGGPLNQWADANGNTAPDPPYEGIQGVRKTVTALATYCGSTPTSQCNSILAVTAANPIFESGVGAAIYYTTGTPTSVTWSLRSIAGGLPSGTSFLDASLGLTGGNLTALAATDKGRLYYSSNVTTGGFSQAFGSTSTRVGDTFYSVHHVYTSSQAFIGAVASNKGVYRLLDPATCTGIGCFRYYQNFSGGAAVVRIGYDPSNPTAPAPDGQNELFIGASGKGFFHTNPLDENAAVARYGGTISDAVRQVQYSPQFTGFCLFAGVGADSSVFAVSGTGGVFKSVDNHLETDSGPCRVPGRTYFTRMNYFPNASETANVTVAALTPAYKETGTVSDAYGAGSGYQNTIYVGTNGIGVLRSDDGAASWRQMSGDGTITGNLPDRAEVTALKVAPTWNGITDGTLFAALRNPIASQRMLYMTTDGGSTWKPLTDLPNGPYVIYQIDIPRTFSPSNPTSRTIYVTTEIGLYKGLITNMATGAVDWSTAGLGRRDIEASNPTSDPPIQAIAMSPTFDETTGCSSAHCRTLFAGVMGQGLYRSTDRAVTWQEISPSDARLVSPYFASIAMAPQYPDTSLPNSLPLYIAFSDMAQNNLERIMYSFDYDSSNPTTVTWNDVNPSASAGHVTSLAISPCFDPSLTVGCAADPGPEPRHDEVLAGTVSSRILQLNHSAGTWTDGEGFYTVPANIQAIAVRPDASNVVFAGTRESGSFLSIDAGLSFRPWSKGQVDKDGRVIRTIHAVGFSSDKTDNQKNEYRLVAGAGLSKGLLWSTFTPPNPDLATDPSPDWKYGELDTGSCTVGSNCPKITCGTFKDVRFAETLDTTPPLPDERYQEFRATTYLDAGCAEPSLQHKAYRSTRIAESGWNLGSVWVSDDGGLPNNGLVANSIPLAAGGSFADKSGLGESTEQGAQTRSSPIFDRPTGPFNQLIWGVSSTSSPSSSGADKNADGMAPSSHCSGGSVSSAYRYSGLAWTQYAGDGGNHELPCSDTNYQAVLAIDADQVVVGSDDAGIWQSRDGGSNWWNTNEGLPSSDIRSISQDASGNILIALGSSSSGGVYFSEAASAGFAWAAYNSGLGTTSLTTLGLSYDAASGGFYAATADDGLLSTTINLSTYTGNPVASFTAGSGTSFGCSTTFVGDEYCEDQSITFCNRTAGRAGTTLTWEWDFDGDLVADSTSESPTYTYSSTGAKSVRLKATRGVATDTFTTSLTVASQIDADITSMTYNSGTGAITISWSEASGQTGFRIWESTQFDGSDKVSHSPTGSCSGGACTASFTPTHSSSPLKIKLQLTSTTATCGTGYPW